MNEPKPRAILGTKKEKDGSFSVVVKVKKRVVWGRNRDPCAGRFFHEKTGQRRKKPSLQNPGKRSPGFL